MASIDQRIVELKFDAKQFRSGIQAAISSLDNLKKNLKMDKAASEFDKVEKASKKVKFNEMSDSLETISSKFSTFGIIGTTALVNIANTAVNAGKRMLSALTEPLIAGGKRRALNIEQAKFQIKGLGYAWEDVEEDINYGVKDTAYGLDAAAKAASQLLASQVKVGDQMKASLRGISGVAAMTSSEYEDISRIFTTVAGNGRLMGDQLQQLSSRGLNAAATLAEYLHVTEGEVRDMVSKGKIDFNTFAMAMDNAFGEHAKSANETFTGSLSNMKAALSRIGAEFATPAYQNLRDIFNSITPAIDGVKKALDPLIKSAAEGMEIVKSFITSKLPGKSTEVKDRIANQLAPVMERLNKILRNLAQTVVNLLTTVRNVASPIINAFTQVFGFKILDLIVGVTSAIKEFTGMLNGGIGESRMMSNLNKTFQGIFTILSAVMQILSKIAYYTTKVLWTAFVKTFGFLSDVVLVITGHFGDWIVSIRNFISEILNLTMVKNVFNAVGGTLNIFGNILRWVYNTVRELIIAITDKAFSAFGVVLKGALVVLKGLAESIDFVVTKIGEFIERVKQLPAVQEAVTKLHDIFTRLKDTILGASTSMTDKFVRAFNKAKQVLGGFISTIKELISKYIQLPSLEEVVTNVLNFLVDAFEMAVDVFTNLKDVLGDMFEKAKEIGSISLTVIIDNFAKLRDRIGEVVTYVNKLEIFQKIFGTIKDGAITTAQATGDFLDQAKNRISTFIEWIKSKFADLTVGDVMAAGVGGTFIAFLVQLTKFTNTADKLVQSLNGLTDWLNGFGGAITKVVKNFAKLEEAKAAQMKMAAVTDIIKSVVLLAGAIALLATMDQEKVQHSAIVLGILATALIGLVSAMNWISKNTSAEVVAESCTQLIAAAGSILVLSLALKLLADIPTGDIIKGIVAIGIIMLEFVGLVALTNKISPELAKSTWNVLALASSMLLMAKAVSIIGSLDTGSLIASVAIMSILMAVLGIMVKIAGTAKLGVRSAAGILLVVISLTVLIGAMKLLANMDGATIAKGISRLIILIGTLSMLFLATSFAGKHAIGAGVAAIAIGIALHIMVAAINNLASIEDSTMKSATESVKGILSIFALISLTTRFAGKNAVGAGAAIMMMAGSMLIISAAMLVLSRMSDDEIKRATDAVVSVMAMFALIVFAMGQVREAKSTMTVIAVTIGILAGALAVLAMIEPRNLLSASIALSLVMGMFALIVASTGFVKKANGTLIIMVGVIGVLAVILSLLAQNPWENVVGSATALSIMLLSLVGAVSILQFFQPSMLKGVLAGIGAMAIVLAAVMGVLALLAALNTATNGEAAEFLRSGIPVLQAIGQAIGEFVGGLIGGIAAGASAALITLANNLTSFMDAMQPFLEMTSEIDDDSIAGVMKLVEMVMLFAFADFIDGINVFGKSGSSIKSMAENLPILSDAMKEFSESLSDVDLTALAVGTQAAYYLAEIANLMRDGGWLQGLVGHISDGMAGLSENLPLFGEALKSYGESVKDVDAEAIDKSISPAKSLIELSNLINGEGGLLQVLGGSNDIAIKGLTENLPNLGEAITAYGESVKDINDDAINRSVGPTKSVIEISNLINGEGGFLQVLGGSNDIAIKGLIENLPNLGTALTEYGKSVGELDASAINSSLEPMRSLIDIGKMLNAENGVINWFAGSTDIATKGFIENTRNLGEAIKAFYESTKDVKSTTTKFAVAVAGGIVDAVTRLAPSGGVLQDFIGSKDNAFESFTHNVVLLGMGIALFADSVSEIQDGGIKSAIFAASGLADVSNKLNPEGGVAQFIYGGSSASLKNLADNALSLGEGISSFSDKVKDIDISGVKGAVYVAKEMVKISNSLESSGGVSGFWFGDKADAFRQFSTNLVTLGDAISSFTESVRGIGSSSTLTSITNSINQFSSSAPNWANSSDMLITIGNRLTSFGGSFAEFIGRCGEIDLAMVIRIVDAMSRLGSALNLFPKNFDGSALINFVNTLRGAATDAVQNFVQALNEGSVQAGAAATNMINFAMNQAITKIVSFHAIFRSHGRTLMLQISYGISDGSASIVAQINSTIGRAVSSVRSYYGSMVSAGEYLCSGVNQGITNGYWWPINNVGNMGDDMVKRLRDRLGIESPSKEGKLIGKFWNMGIAIGAVKYASLVFAAIDETADGMEDRMYERFGSNDFGGHLQPIITPELDLSQVNKGLDDLDNRFALGAGIPINMQGVLLSSALTNMRRNNLRNDELQNGTPTQVVNNFDMTQNNYSPKALSRIDIYRDTKNQFSRLKREVNA